MRRTIPGYVFFVCVTLCAFVFAFRINVHAEPDASVESAPIASALDKLAAQPDAPPSAAEIAEFSKDIGAYRAAKKSGDRHATMLALAALIAFALKHLVDQLKKIPKEDLTDKARHALPWVLSVLGVVVAVVTKYAMGVGWVDAIIVGGSAPGAILVDNLWDAAKGLLLKKKDEPPAEKKPPIIPPPLAPAALVLFFLSAFLALPSCCGQLQRARAERLASDQRSATATLDAVKKLRDPTCVGDKPGDCRETNLRVIEAQAEAVPR